MPGPLFAESSRAFKASLAAQLGCDPAAFESHALSVVERPEGSCERQLAVVATCGTGSVLSVRHPRLGDWAREQPLETHFRIFLPSFLEGMAAHARELGYVGARSHSPSQGMVLADDVPPRNLPAGYRIAELPLAEQQRLRPGREFENALAEPGEDAKIASIRIVFAAFAADGSIAGVAGVWDQYPGIDEIGLDVARAHRGLGLATTLTIHATRWIRAGGRWPIYTCGVTNVRSMNNGLSAGYRPLWLLSVVYLSN
jgi:GNAT superfamily N-acetyltransferase